jgi:hypothetical protein
MATKKTKPAAKKYHLPRAIKNVRNVADFFDYLLYVRNLSFHPDDRFEDYVENGTNGKRSFTDEEAKKFNKMMNDAWRVCKMNKRDIYSIGLRKMLQRLQLK